MKRSGSERKSEKIRTIMRKRERVRETRNGREKV